MPDDASIVAQRSPHRQRRASAARHRFLHEQCREREEHCAANSQRAIDRAPPSQRCDPDAERWRNDRGKSTGEIHVRLPDARLRAAEMIAHRCNHQHGHGPRARTHEETPQEQRRQRRHKGTKRPKQRKCGATKEQQRASPMAVRHRAHHQRTEREARHEHAHRERGSCWRNTQRRRRGRQHGQTHVGGERRQRHERAEQQREGQGVRAESHAWLNITGTW